MASYDGNSPWGNTQVINDQYLDVLSIRPVPAEPDDILYTIQTPFTYRPDLLAHALYGTHKLWWVFAQRNMNVLKDPVYDFVPGTQIYLPQGQYLQKLLGT